MIRAHLRVAQRRAVGEGGGLARGTHLVLVSWRWFACLAAGLLWWTHDQPLHATDRRAVLLAVAVATTAVVTLAGRRGWEAMQRRPLLLLPDVVVSAVVLAAGGPDVFLLYAVSPLFAAGVLLGPAAAAARESALRASLERKNDELSRRNHELQTFEEIASVMQTTMDVSEVQERVVAGVTDRLGFPRALLGLCDESEVRVTGWLARGRGGADIDHLLTLDMASDRGVFGDALWSPAVTLLQRSAVRTDCDRALMATFDADVEALVAVPIRCRGHLVGGLFVEPPSGWAGLDPDMRTALDRLATQAGLALANVRLCVERTQKLTQEQERMRIAADMHDGIAQALFGIVYQLSGSARQLPPQAPLRTQLEDLGGVAQKTLEQVRHAIFDIWPSDLTCASLARELDEAVRSLAPQLALDVVIAPEYEGLDLDIRKAVFRIAQEAVNNVIKHAQARSVRVRVDCDLTEVVLRVEDDGIGTDAAAPGGGGIGLRGMTERAEALGGTLRVATLPTGTAVVAELPRTVCRVR